MIGLSLHNPGFLGSLTAAGGGGVLMGTAGSFTAGSNVVDIPGMYTIYTYGVSTISNPTIGTTSSIAIREVITTVTDFGGSLTRGTRVRLKPSTFNSEIYVDSNGLIYGDYMTPRVFTIGGVTATLKPGFLGDAWGYVDNTSNTDLFNLQARVGQALTVKVEMTVPGAIIDIQGTLGVGYSSSAGTFYGYSPGVPQMFIAGWGSVYPTPSGIIAFMSYSENNNETKIQFVPGTYTGQRGTTLNVTNSYTINGSTNFNAQIGSVVRPMQAYNGSAWVSGDPFGLAGKLNQNVPFAISIP